jgi:hypothetical protein
VPTANISNTSTEKQQAGNDPLVHLAPGLARRLARYCEKQNNMLFSHFN